MEERSLLEVTFMKVLRLGKAGHIKDVKEVIVAAVSKELWGREVRSWG